MKENKNTNKKNYYLIDAVMVRVFFVLLIFFAVLAIIPAFRPSYSETEKRELKKFPELKLSSVVSGKYFDDINLWYADTFPLRDEFININGAFKGTFGVDNSVEIHGDIGLSDEIPDDETEVKQETEITSSVVSSEKTESIISQTSSAVSSTESTVSQNSISSSNVQTSSQSSSSKVTSSKPKKEPAVETLGAVLRVKNVAYEYYNFNKSVAKAYASHISYAADALKGKANVYGIVAPTSMGITLSDDIAKDINSSNQKEALDYIYGRMSANVIKVNPYNTLKLHKDEYIYFRTDHHWTSLGAYYAYSDLMNVKGATPLSLKDNFIKHQFKGFLGSFYTQTKSPQLSKTPDTVVAYEPKSVNTIETRLDKKTTLIKKIISDGNALSTPNKYLCFISGDKPFGYIRNNNVKDGSSCLIVKESYGNAIVPFFAETYNKVRVIDYRYFSSIDSRNLVEFVEEYGIKDVIFVNNISATRNKALVEQLGNFIRE